MIGNNTNRTNTIIPYRYNFGLFTQLWDYLFNTLRHPDETTRHFALATKKKRKKLAELHKMYSNTNKED